MRVLIVEDEPVSARVLAEMITPFGESEIARNGVEAFDKFRAACEDGKAFDLVLLDIMLPEASGQEFLAAIRKLEEENEISQPEGVKVIMTTAVQDPQDVYQAHAHGCADYLVKPVDRDKLLKTLRRLELIGEEEG